jgi:hypothetical protein
MSTLLISNGVVQPSNWPGFLVFSRVPSVFKAENAVRVPPRAQLFPQVSGPFGGRVCTNFVVLAPSGAFLMVAVAVACCLLAYLVDSSGLC